MKKPIRIEELREIIHQKIAVAAKLHPNRYKISKILEILYLPAGIFINPKLQRFLRAYMLCLYCGFGYSIIGALVTTQDPRSHLMENLYCVFACCTALTSLLAGRHHEGYLRHLHREALHYEEISREFAALSNATIQRRIRQISGVILVLIFVAFATPLYAALFTNADTDDFIVLIYPIWYPWRRDNMFKYLCSLSMQYASSLMGYYLLIFCIGCFVLATLFVHARFSLLGRKISSMKSTRGRLSEKRLQKEFVLVIEEHQALIKFTRQTISCFVITATLVITYASGSAILLMALFLTNISVILKLKLVSLCTLAMLSLMVCCFCGELVSDVNSILQDAIYGTPWYASSAAFRKLSITFMLQNQIPFEMKSYDLYKLSVPLIATAFKLCYTCIQILINRAN